MNAVLENLGTDQQSIVITPGDFDLLVLNNIATLILSNSSNVAQDLSVAGTENSWKTLLDLYPGKFRAGLSQLRLTKPDGNEIVAYISLDPLDEFKMVLNIDSDTVPTNTVISGRGTVDAIINPETFNPSNRVVGSRYLILENINVGEQAQQPGYDGPAAWKNPGNANFVAHANDIIEWTNLGWAVVFNSNEATEVTYITNAYTGVQYKWDLNSWSKSFEGVYSNGAWRLIL
jgi:hypothetical protein